MKTIDIARAWKDRNYRKSLRPEELASIPANPAGFAEPTEEQLREVAGGFQGSCNGPCGTPPMSCDLPR